MALREFPTSRIVSCSAYVCVQLHRFCSVSAVRAVRHFGQYQDRGTASDSVHLKEHFGQIVALGMVAHILFRHCVVCARVAQKLRDRRLASCRGGPKRDRCWESRRRRIAVRVRVKAVTVRDEVVLNKTGRARFVCLPLGETGNLPGTARIPLEPPLALPAGRADARSARPGVVRASSNMVVVQDEFALETPFKILRRLT